MAADIPYKKIHNSSCLSAFIHAHWNMIQIPIHFHAFNPELCLQEFGNSLPFK